MNPFLAYATGGLSVDHPRTHPYDDFVGMPSFVPTDPPPHNMYHSKPTGSYAAANTVCMSDMCSTEPYGFGSSMTSMIWVSRASGLHSFGGSDTESGISLSPLDESTSPALQHGMSVVNIGEGTGESRRDGNSTNQTVLSHLEGYGKEELGNMCKVSGCNKSFNRKEHLKRHERA